MRYTNKLQPRKLFQGNAIPKIPWIADKPFVPDLVDDNGQLLAQNQIIIVVKSSGIHVVSDPDRINYVKTSSEYISSDSKVPVCSLDLSPTDMLHALRIIHTDCCHHIRRHPIPLVKVCVQVVAQHIMAVPR